MADLQNTTSEIPSQEPKISQPIAQSNPLARYYRQPKIYIKLPSRGRFYPEGAIDTSETGEYAVYSMTAKDELLFKTPDALMNGQSTVEVIRSCVPAILNPWQMPSIDLDAVLIAIRIATYGETMDISAGCTHCNHINDYQMDLVNHLSKFNSFSYDNKITVEPLTIYIRPYTYKEVTKNAIKVLEQEKIFDIINNNELSDEEKIDQFGISFNRLTELTVDIVVGAVEKIVAPEGEVTDRDQIRDFMRNAPREIYEKVQERLSEMKENLEMKAADVECAECSKKFTTKVTLDQSNFFEVRS